MNPNPPAKPFRITPGFVVLDLIGLALVLIGATSFVYQHTWLPEELRFEGFGVAFIAAGVVLMTAAAVLLVRDLARRRATSAQPGEARPR